MGEKQSKREALTAEQVVTIREEYAAERDAMSPGESVLDVDDRYAAEYGVSRTTIARLTSGASYQSTPGPLTPRPGNVARARRAGFAVASRVVVTDAAGRLVHENVWSEGHSVTVTPVAVPIDYDEEVASSVYDHEVGEANVYDLVAGVDDVEGAK